MARGRYQRGSLALRNNAWVARWRDDVIGPDGTLHRVRRAATLGTRAQLPTKRLAQRQMDLILARVNSPLYAVARIATFEAFVERWKKEVLPQRKPSTQKAARWHLVKYLLPEFGPAMVEQIGNEQAQKLITKLGHALAPKTVVNIVGTLSAILATAKDWGYRVENLNWRRLSFPQRRERISRRFFSAQEARAIIELAEKKWPAEPWGLLFALAAMTGMRAGELMALKAEDVDMERKLVCVRRSVWYGQVTAPKSRASERVLPLPITLMERLRRYLAMWTPSAGGFLFATRTGKPVVIGNIVQRKLWPVLDELKIERCGMHAFRHGHASMLVAMGAPMTVARDQLGHTDPRLTFEVYSHAISGAQRESIEQLAHFLDSDGLKEKLTEEVSIS